MDQEMSIPGYDLFCKDRSKHGGRVVLYIKEAYNATRWLEIECDNIGCGYFTGSFNLRTYRLHGLQYFS